MGLSSQFRQAGSPLTAADFNANVGAIKENTITGGQGMLMDRSPMGGTSLTPIPQSRQIMPKSVIGPHPFELRVINVGTTSAPNWKKIFYFPDGSCDVNGGWATCKNPVFPPDYEFSKDGTWFYVDGPEGTSENANSVPREEDIEYVYLHVQDRNGVRRAVVTNAQKIPTDFAGYETDCVCIGRFAPHREGYQPSVKEQFVTGQVQLFGTVFPFKLNAVNVGSDDDPEWVKVFYWTECAVFVDGYVVECRNRRFLSSETSDDGWLMIAPEVGPKDGDSGVLLQEDCTHVYLHVKLVTENDVEKYVAIVTNSVEPPDLFAGDESYFMTEIGEFTVPSAADVKRGVVPSVVQQHVTSQINLSDTDVDPYPFKIKYVSTESKYYVYVPDGALSSPYPFYSEVNVGGGWIRYTDSDRGNGSSAGEIGLQVCLASSGSFKEPDGTVKDPKRVYCRFGNPRVTYIPGGLPDDVKTFSYGILLGYANDGKPINLVRSAITIVAESLSSVMAGGGGDGDSSYVLTDERTDDEKAHPGILGYDGTDADGKDKFVVAAYLEAELVKLIATDEAGNESATSLTDYLSGDSEVQGLGNNVNTENFGDLLGATETPDEDAYTGENNNIPLAAPSYHTHTLTQILASTADGENLIEIFSTAGLFDYNTLGDDTLLRFEDIGTGTPNKDGTASSGTLSSGLALADHVHPLNIGSSADEYAAGDHTHGNITTDGKISGSGLEGALLSVDEDGTIYADQSIVPAGFSGGALDFLGEITGLFDFNSDESVTLSTDKLKYPTDSDHNGNCLLMVDDDGAVLHSGNDMYDDVAALAGIIVRGYTDSTSTSGTVKYSSIGGDSYGIAPNTGSKAKAVGFSSNETTASLIDVATFANDGITPSSDSGEGSSGTSDYAARADHVHPFMAGTGHDSYAFGDHNHDGTYLGKPSSTGILYWDTNALSAKTIGTSEGNVAAGDHTHGNITTDGKISGSGLECALLSVDEDGTIYADQSIVPAGFSGGALDLIASIADAFNYDSDGTASIPANSVRDSTCTSDDCIAVFKTLGEKNGVLAHSTPSSLRYSELLAMADVFDFEYAGDSKASTASLSPSAIVGENASTGLVAYDSASDQFESVGFTNSGLVAYDSVEMTFGAVTSDELGLLEMSENGTVAFKDAKFDSQQELTASQGTSMTDTDMLFFYNKNDAGDVEIWFRPPQFDRHGLFIGLGEARLACTVGGPVE